MKQRIGWKAASIFIAIILWVTLRWDLVNQNINQKRSEDILRAPLSSFIYEEVPILILKKSNHDHHIRLHPSSVRVKLKGHFSLLSKMKSAEIKVYADLVESHFTHSFYTSLQCIKSDEWEVEDIEPREVLVEILYVDNKLD